jgi:hypothetical protein
MLPHPSLFGCLSPFAHLTIIAVAVIATLLPDPGFGRSPDALPGTGWVAVNEASPWSESPEPEILASVLDSISLTVDVPGFEVETVYHGSDEFKKLTFLGESFTSETGKPEIPVVRMMLAIADCDSYSLTVELGDSTEFSDATIWPVPGWAVGHQDECENVYEVFAIDEEFYEEDVLYPEAAAIIADDGWVRDQRYVILEIRPVRCNPGLSLLRCYSSISVEVELENPVETNLLGAGPLESACRSVMANYDGVGAWSPRGGRADPCIANIDWCSTVSECRIHGTDYLMIVEDSIIDTETVEARAGTVDLDLAEAVCISDPASPECTRVLLRFDVPPALIGTTIDFAELRVTVTADAEQVAEVEVPVEAFPVTREWIAEAVEWDGGWDTGVDSWDDRVGTYCDVLPRDGSVLDLDVTEIVQVWCRGEEENLGIVLVPYLPDIGTLTGIQAEPSLRVSYTRARIR